VAVAVYVFYMRCTMKDIAHLSQVIDFSSTIKYMPKIVRCINRLEIICHRQGRDREAGGFRRIKMEKIL
jgi:hypothetical protein